MSPTARPALVLASLVVLASASSGCDDATTEASAECVSADDCGHCQRCTNGRCVVDLELPTCLDESEDPCDGVDNDGNGLVDDPEVCWAQVFGYDGPEGARCYGLSPNAPPTPCATYAAVASSPLFALAARPIDGTVAVRQCSLGQDHILVPETPLFPETAPDAYTASDAWRVLGYDCSVVLGWAYVDRPPFGERSTPQGVASRLTRYFSPLARGGELHGYLLGREPPPLGATCEPNEAIWVVTTHPLAGDAGEPCLLAPCAEHPTGRVLLQTPEDGVTVSGGGFAVTWRLQNTGALPWLAGWGLDRTAGHFGHTSHMILRNTVAPGETYDFELGLLNPEAGVALYEAWALFDPEDEAVVEMSIRFDVATEDAATVSIVRPARAARFTPGQAVTFTFDVENSGASVWNEYYALAHREGVVLHNANFYFEASPSDASETLRPGEMQTLDVGGLAPAAPDRYVDTWSIRTGSADDVPIAADAGTTRTFDTVIDVVDPEVGEGTVRAVAIDTPLTLPAHAPFVQSYLIENTGDRTWESGWALTHVSGALSRVDSVSLADPVEPGESVLLAVPMRAPAQIDDHGPWRDGWELRDASQRVIGLFSPAPDGTVGYGTKLGAWLWTEVSADTPCAAQGE